MNESVPIFYIGHSIAGCSFQFNFKRRNRKMSNTALRAEKAKEIIFISDAHEKFYYEKLKEVRYQAV